MATNLVPLNANITLEAGELNTRYRHGSNCYMKFDIFLIDYGVYVPLSTEDGYIRTRVLTEVKVRAGDWRDAPTLIDLVSQSDAKWSVDDTYFLCDCKGYTLRWFRYPDHVMRGMYILDSCPNPKKIAMMQLAAERTNGCYARFVDPEQVLTDSTLGIFDEGYSKTITGFEIY